MLNRLVLVCRVLLAMARKRFWEPLLIIVAIVIATAGLSSVTLINQGASEGELASSQPGWFAGGSVTAKSTDTPITRADYVALRTAGFTYLVAITETEAQISCPANESRSLPITITGVDITAALSNAGAFGGMSGMLNRQTANKPIAKPADTTLASNPNASIQDITIRAAVSEQTARYLNCNTSLTGFGSLLFSTPQVVTGLPDERLVLPIDVFYTEDRTPENYPLTALIVARALSNKEQARLQQALPEHLALTIPPAFTSKGTLADSFQLNLWAMGALMAVVSIFIILNALMLMYRARLPAFIRLRQAGVGSRMLLSALFTELTFYCLIASPVGVFAGAALTLSLTPVLQATFSGLFESAFVTPSPVLTQLIAGAFVVSLAALAMFFIAPAKQLAGALSRNRVQAATLPPLKRLLCSLVLLMLIALTLVFASSTATALLSVAAVLLCASALLILWLAPLLGMVRRLVPPTRPLASYVVASAQMLSGKSRLAVCAFFIALSANIGMNVMTDSFRQATLDWLEQRLTAPAYLYSMQPVDETSLPDSLRLLPVYQGVTSVSDAGMSDAAGMSDVAGMNNTKVTLRTYPSPSPNQINLPLEQETPSTPADFYAGEAVYVNQQLAFRLGVRTGDRLETGPVFTLGLERQLLGGKHVFRVAGIYPDYGNPEMQIIVSKTLIGMPEARRNVAAIYPALATSSSLAAQELSSLQKTLPDDANLISSASLIAVSMETFDRTFVVTDALNIATLLVAGLAFAVSVTLLTMDLKPQLAMLRTLGISQRSIKTALTAQYMLLCAATAAIAVPFGILLAWIFIEYVNRFAFYWVYPLSLNWIVLLKSVAVSLAVVLVVLLLPLGRLNSKIDLRQEERL